MVKEIPKWSVILLSEHFTSSEMKCKCSYDTCTFMYYDEELFERLEKKRSELNEILNRDKQDRKDWPFVVASGFRCTRHNKDCGGVPGSQHLQGKAIDIWIPGQNMVSLAEHFEDFDGLGRYPQRNFLHLDVRGYRARWSGR